MKLPVHTIKTTGGTQPRSAINWVIVQEYSEQMMAGQEFPPVVVFYDGQSYWLADGFHRVQAANNAQILSIEADVRQGTLADAQWYSYSVNASHGLRRTREDARRQIEGALRHPAGAAMSDREIARHVGVSPTTVGMVRAALTVQVGQSALRIGADGRLINTAPIAAATTARAQAARNPGNGHATAAQPFVSARIENVFASDPAPEALPEVAPDAVEVVTAPATTTMSLGDQRAVGDVTVYCYDSRHLDEIIDAGSVQMVITSPPYNVGIDYSDHDDNMVDEEYQDLLCETFTRSFHALCDGGRIAVVVPFGVGRNPWRPLASEVAHILTDIGFELRGQIVWDKGTSGNRTTWGSWRLPTNPSLRDTTECILIAHKGAAALAVPQGVLDADGYSPWLPSEKFMSLACDRWTVAPASAQSIGHPAPFPVRLVEMLMRFYSYRGAHVLDPFAGSGTVGVTAARLGCRASLVEISPAYCEMAVRRVENNI